MLVLVAEAEDVRWRRENRLESPWPSEQVRCDFSKGFNVTSCNFQLNCGYKRGVIYPHVGCAAVSVTPPSFFSSSDVKKEWTNLLIKVACHALICIVCLSLHPLLMETWDFELSESITDYQFWFWFYFVNPGNAPPPCPHFAGLITCVLLIIGGDTMTAAVSPSEL